MKSATAVCLCNVYGFVHLIIITICDGVYGILHEKGIQDIVNDYFVTGASQSISFALKVDVRTI